VHDSIENLLNGEAAFTFFAFLGGLARKKKEERYYVLLEHF